MMFKPSLTITFQLFSVTESQMTGRHKRSEGVRDTSAVIFTARSKVWVFGLQCNEIIAGQSATNRTAMRYIGSAEYGN